MMNCPCCLQSPPCPGAVHWDGPEHSTSASSVAERLGGSDSARGARADTSQNEGA